MKYGVKGKKEREEGNKEGRQVTFWGEVNLGGTEKLSQEKGVHSLLTEKAL